MRHGAHVDKRRKLTMKVTSFHFMPYRDLPEDFPKGLASSWVDAPWWEYGDANKVTDYYNWSLDELMLAAKLGFDGIGTNEHHQGPYGFMCNPNLFGAILARLTRDQGLENVALVQLGATIVNATPPIRIAEEYAVLDCISGGRLIAGLPLGLGIDANISYGIPPMEQRERWREGVELMLKAWTAKEFFAWNGKYFQLPKVNLWPRPVQDPHPPLLIPGGASASTWDFCHDCNLP
jgi:alkanesulfonate monooxygenase SsuD/methylene tetrahydromethanopterin reductase-like flavin-dependent oxidoreductase (luciferase family)